MKLWCEMFGAIAKTELMQFFTESKFLMRVVHSVASVQLITSIECSAEIRCQKEGKGKPVFAVFADQAKE